MEEKKKSNVGLIVLVVVLLIISIGMGVFIFINKDKLTVKENSETVIKDDSKDVNTKSESNVSEDCITSDVVEDDGKYIEKVYSMDNDSFVFFKNGSCVIKSSLEYTADCEYYVENNSIHITSAKAGPSNKDKHNYVYNIVQDGNDEYIQLSTDSNKSYKYLK